MNSSIIKLTPDEKNKFEFKMFQFKGMQIAMNQFVYTKEYEYNEEHYDRLLGSYVEMYKNFTEYIIELLQNRQYTNVSIENLNYEYSHDGILTINI